jgi:hypothetical protein
MWRFLALFVAVSSYSLSAHADPQWLELMNQYRAMAKQPPVTEDPALSKGDAIHAEFTAKNQVLEHAEDPTLPGYSTEGDHAGRSSNGAEVKSEQDAIEQWMQAPFHALGILDPRLKTTGYGQFTDHGATYAWLNVISGMGPLPADTQFPIFWPGDHTATTLLSHWGEVPEPTHSCPGYPTKSGLPLLVQLKPGVSPNVTASSMLEADVPVQHCILTAENFKYEDAAWQTTARSILSARNAIIILPRDPLKKGFLYKMSITVSGTQYDWSFRTH